MERIKGQMAATLWDNLSDASRKKILLRLREMTNEMRAIPSPNDWIASVDGGSLWDCRLPSNLGRFGPFEDTQAFHSYLRDGINKAPPGYPGVDGMIAWQQQQWAKPVFTHGDLSSLNILLRGDDIVAIIDWETAGWYPPYWEYTSAHQVNPRNHFWKDFVDQFLQP